MYNIILAGFDNELAAESARLDLLKMQSKDQLELKDAIVISKLPAGEIKLKQTYEFAPNNTIVASWLGTLIGACLGIPFGPLGPLIGSITGTALGAAVGALTDALELQEIREKLADTLTRNNAAALIVITDEDNTSPIIETLENADASGKITQKTLSNKTQEQLQKGLDAIKQAEKQ
ncbi:DUF1269 domain-containing protein [Candidatus Paracaedibacter symbiosus]|uniref:DUF1269 domain-containing protein n=1 Tax=Candidatus Paracaedibacter symbiosus TaxID=244582 RepID=UPI0005098354|nr:DUF1269 domain-containing protein [Candidatus Paracaedibacter symbiosus]